MLSISIGTERIERREREEMRVMMPWRTSSSEEEGGV